MFKDGIYGSSGEYIDKNLDPMIEDAAKVIIEAGQASTSLLQRSLKLGYSRAARIIDQLEELGVVGPYCGAKPREVFMTPDQYIKKHDEIYASFKGIPVVEKTAKSALDELLEWEIDDFIKTTSGDRFSDWLDKLGISTDWSNDGYFVDKLDNYVFPRANDDMQIKFINNLITYASPDKIKLLLIDEGGVCFNEFQGAPHLLLPVVSYVGRIEGALGWACSEAEKRYRMFTDRGVRDISGYNQLIKKIDDESDVCELPHIIVIINEAYQLLNNSVIDDSLTKLLLKSKNAGIYTYLFSRFSQKSLSLGVKNDLMKSGDPVDLERTFSRAYGKSDNVSIEDVDSSMNGYEFEEFCGSVLQKNGFTNITVTQSSGDFGVDIIAYKDEIKYAIQCKKYSSPVGIEAVQQVLGSKTMFNCHVGVVLTNNYFTPAALELAKNNNILMWDRGKLVELIEDK